MTKEDEIVLRLLEKWPIEDEVQFTEFNISDKLKKNSFLQLQYNQQLCKEKMVLERLQQILEKKIGERYHHYRFNFDEELTKQEIEKYYLPQDPEIKEIKNLILDQQVTVGFFEAATKAIGSQNWNMKNFIETLKGGF